MTRTCALAWTIPLAACTLPAGAPTEGTYTLQFPSTAAAVAVESIQLFVFDMPTIQRDRASYCASLIRARRNATLPKSVAQTAPASVCDLERGARATFPYGEHAVLAVARRAGSDLLMGCTVQTFGDGDAPLPITLALVDVAHPVPQTRCTTLGAYCQKQCPAP